MLITNFFLALPNIVLGRDGLLSLENPVRMLLMLPMIFAVIRFGLNLRYICVGLAVGMLAAVIVVGWQYHVLEMVRPSIHYNPVLFSEVAMSAFAVLLAACLTIQDRLVPLYLAGLIAALYCVILSGTRGTLLAIVPIVAFVLWWGWRQRTGREMLSWRRMLLIPGILLFLGTALISNEHFVNRLQVVVKQTNGYLENRDIESAIGLRLEIWRGALMAGLENPVLGIGNRERGAYIKQKIVDGELKPYVAIMNNTHNDYLYAFQSRGFPGLLLILLVYSLPMLIFIRGLTAVKKEQLFASLGGVLLIIGYATYSLTSMPIHDGLPLVFYLVITSLCIGIVKHSQNAVSADHSRKSGR